MAYTSITVQGPHEVSQPDHESQLQTQLQSIPKTTTELLIGGDTPLDPEWALLGAHFSAVENLKLEGHSHNQDLNDKLIPLHRPLQQLTLFSPYRELVQSPFVRKGLVGHPILFYACYLRFEGPTTDNLSLAEQEALSRGETGFKPVTAKLSKPDEKKIEVVDFPT